MQAMRPNFRHVNTPKLHMQNMQKSANYGRAVTRWDADCICALWGHVQQQLGRGRVCFPA
jgi:hypothetical protein